jgi:hypothetical protein
LAPLRHSHPEPHAAFAQAVSAQSTLPLQSLSMPSLQALSAAGASTPRQEHSFTAHAKVEGEDLQSLSAHSGSAQSL